MCRRRDFFRSIGYAIALLLIVKGALAAATCDPAVGTLISVEGLVEVQRSGSFDWQSASTNQAVCEGDTVRAGRRSRAAVQLVNEAVLRLDERTTIRLVDIAAEEQESSVLDLLSGVMQSFSRKPRRLAVNAPYLNATIEGTEFVITATDDGSDLTMLEGTVLAANDDGEVRVTSGEAVAGRPGKAPVSRTVVRPRDAVQWSLFYPPILSILGGRAGQVPEDFPPSLRPAAILAASGDTYAAFEALDAVPESERGALYHTFRAALLLDVGQVDEAKAAIDAALARDPNAGLAYALRSVINVVNNEREQALENGSRAVELAPRSAASHIALSYAYQANFRIPDARDTLLAATEAEPGNALAWARLSEVWLMLGYRNRSRGAAEKAVELQPELARTHTVRGFAELSQFRTRAAREAFLKAIALNSADPLPRLGIGLSRIREGALEAGRADLEAAVGLDANNALYRAYLGKAYFEEKRAPLDAEQFAIAKELDPKDPTAYLYDGIRLQTENQPVAAFRELERSVELNDERAVYRGRLELDSDQAARQTSLARVYNTLGFIQLGLEQSRQSLSLDPSNTSAHRYLSDTYQLVRRREISRVSELFQAQMLQDINLNPVQPSLAVTNINLVSKGGPTSVGFNEFTPLFESNGAQFNAYALGGNNNTGGGEGVVSGIYNNISVSAGAFGYTTDGWRSNNDLEQSIFNFFGQAALTPELNAQIEVRRRHSNEGDLPFNFSKTAFQDNLKISRDQDTVRAGLRYSPAPHSDILLSYMYGDLETDEKDRGPDTIFGTGFTQKEKNRGEAEANQGEAQYIYREDIFNVVAGGGFSDAETHLKTETSVGGFFIPGASGSEHGHIEQGRGYVYGNVEYPQSVTWTVGGSYDDYEEDQFDRQSVNPKVGVQWQVTDDLSLRAAAFKVMKPALVTNRLLEPTQVAGFNQFFDDINATTSWRYGFGSDLRVTENLSIGSEISWRELDEPVFEGKDARIEDREEQLHRVYAYWTPYSELALSAEYVYDYYKADRGVATKFDNLPRHVRTHKAPLMAQYFWDFGLFAGVTGTLVHQDVRREAQFRPDQEDGNDTFFLVDAAVGFRFPKRSGIASLEVTNIFDTAIKYQDDSYREFRDEPTVGPFFPERIIVGRVTLNF